MERRVETIIKFVEGKGSLKEKIVTLLSNNGLIGPSGGFHGDSNQWNKAFENALRRLTATGLIVEQEENLVFTNSSYRLKKYKITQKGLEYLKNDSSLTVNLKRLICLEDVLRTSLVSKDETSNFSHKRKSESSAENFA